MRRRFIIERDQIQAWLKPQTTYVRTEPKTVLSATLVETTQRRRRRSRVVRNAERDSGAR